ncbi:ABC transporter permease subunit [Burkholderia multivorans]|uniref:ABC transporter permease subunit n=1 Tax=Burkholderia multivorans TaxID=87883 RepID=UPI001C25C0F6|nr:ABC transporter permease subunit [Burkholderia multivorans]MBU9576263.1 ABC transporter permease subunit [Burkholderia multivorans]MDN7953819.1 ABC transporter permease subunit [Burkholderia multivorans]MDN7999958.1 ABC transporter permease subunit [Burkholderia multivorans]
MKTMQMDRRQIGRGPATGYTGSLGMLMGRLARPWVLTIPALLILVPCYIVPIGKLFLTSFGDEGFSLQNYALALANGSWMHILYRSLLVSLEVTGLTVLIGYPLALAIARALPRIRDAMLMLVAIPLWTSTLVRSFSWIVLLGREGVVNSVAMDLGLIHDPVKILYTGSAVLIGYLHVTIPYLVFPLVGVMRQIPEGLISAGMTLGAGKRTAFWLVFFPLSLPGLLSGAVLVFVLCVGYFVTPALLGGLQQMNYVMLIQQQVEVALDWPMAATMSAILLVVTLLIVAVFSRVLRADGDVGVPRPTATTGGGWKMATACTMLGRLVVWMRRLTPSRRPTRAGRAPTGVSAGTQAWAVLVIAILIVPILLLIPLSLSAAPYLQFPPASLSLRWYGNFFSRGDWTGAVLLSLEVGLASTLISTVAGTAAAVAISRSEGPLIRVVHLLVISPVFVPTLIVAVAMYFAFAPLQLVGTRTGLVIAHAVISLPVVLIVMTGSLKRISTGPERAARSLGAGVIRAFMSTTFNAIVPGVVSAALFAFLTSFDDVVMALFISGSNSTLPKRMWDGVQLEIDPTIAAASSLLVLISIVLTCGVLALRKRESG